MISDRFANAEIERLVAKARQHPDALETWFRMMPAAAVDTLAMAMFTMLVSELSDV